MDGWRENKEWKERKDVRSGMEMNDSVGKGVKEHILKGESKEREKERGTDRTRGRERKRK